MNLEAFPDTIKFNLNYLHANLNKCKYAYHTRCTMYDMHVCLFKPTGNQIGANTLSNYYMHILQFYRLLKIKVSQLVSADNTLNVTTSLFTHTLREPVTSPSW